jgi:hypothetical protein
MAYSNMQYSAQPQGPFLCFNSQKPSLVMGSDNKESDFFLAKAMFSLLVKKRVGRPLSSLKAFFTKLSPSHFIFL